MTHTYFLVANEFDQPLYNQAGRVRLFVTVEQAQKSIDLTFKKDKLIGKKRKIIAVHIHYLSLKNFRKVN